ncbi:hypothetical protein BKH44_04745 [Helicobacter sp. 13S00477-4]|nr:hypothetical protein BKH44_04745 [Helicobacter sp. 13S00477-4]
MKETFQDYFSNPFITLNAKNTDRQSPNTQNLFEENQTLDNSAILSFTPLISNPYESVTLTSIDFQTPKAYDKESLGDFITSSYFYERFIQRSPLAQKVFLSHFSDGQTAIFYNSDLFLNQILSLQTLNIIEAKHQKIQSLKANEIIPTPIIQNPFAQNSFTLKFTTYGWDKQEAKGILANHLYAESKNFYNHSSIQANQLQINAKELLSNQGKLKASDLILHSDGMLYHSGDIDSNEASLDAKNIHIASEIKQSQISKKGYKEEFVFNTASLKSKDLKINAKDELFISHSNIYAGNKIDLSGDLIDMNTQRVSFYQKDSYKEQNQQDFLGTRLQAEQINIEAKGNLSLKNAELNARGALKLKADKNIFLYSSQNHSSSNTHYYKTQSTLISSTQTQDLHEQSNDLSTHNQLYGKNISIDSKGSIYSEGSVYDAKEDLSINATKDYIEKASQNQSFVRDSHLFKQNVFGFEYKKDEQTHSYESLTHNASMLKAKNIHIHTGNATFLQGVNSQALHTQIHSKTTTFSSIQDKYTYTHSSNQKSFFGLNEKSNQESSSHSLNRKSHLSNHDLLIKSQDNINIIGSDISTTHNAGLISQNGNVNILPGYDIIQSDSHTEEKGFSGFSMSLSDKFKVGADFDYNKSFNHSGQKKAVGSNLEIGEDLNIIAKGNTNIIGSNIFAKGNISIESENIHILAAQNTSNHFDKDFSGNLNVSLEIGNAYVDAYHSSKALKSAGNALRQATKDYQKIAKLYAEGKASYNALEEAKLNIGLASISVGNATLNFTSSLANAASSVSAFGTGFYASVSATLSGEEHSKIQENISFNPSVLKTNANLNLKASDSINQTGSITMASQNISYGAKYINLSATAQHFSQKEMTKNISTTISYRTNGLGMNASASTQSNTTQAIYHHYSKAIGKHITFNAQEDINLTGANLYSNTANIQAKNLNIQSLSDTLYSNAKGGGIGFGFSKNKQDNSIDTSLSLNRGYIDKSWVEEISSIKTQDQLQINITQHTNLIGGIIASDSQQLDFKTHTLNFKDIANKDNSSNHSTRLNLSLKKPSNYPDNTDSLIGLWANGYEKEGKALATLGLGKVEVSSPHQMIGLNRDISKVSIVSKDQITSNLQGELQIKGAFFTQTGRQKIKNDFSNTIHNTIKAMNATGTLLINPFLSVYEGISDENISLKGIAKQWKANQHSMLAINNTDMDTIHHLKDKNIEQIQNAFGIQDNNKIYLYADTSDPIKGFYDKANEEIYINMAYHNLSDSKDFMHTYGHENAHKITHNENIAQNAGKFTSFLYQINDALKSNTSKDKLRKNKFNYAYANNDASRYNHYILETNNHKASLVEQEDRDNLIVFIHGTWSNPYAFTQDFINSTKKAFNDDKIYRFQWSGANHDQARQQGGKQLNDFIKNYHFQEGEPLIIITHSHGGNVAKVFSNLYDYDRGPKPVIINIGTPNREDYVMNPKVEEYYNVYNVRDYVVQGFAGGKDFPIGSELLPIFGDLKNYISKFKYKDSSQIPKEPNAINVKIDQDYLKFHYLDRHFIDFLFGNHTKTLNPDTIRELQNFINERKNK